MGRKKLTLSVEEHLTRRAKAIAKERGTSVPQLVETFFTALEQNEGSSDVRQDRHTGAEPVQDADAASLAGHEPSDWARQWRGAFTTEEGKTYPDHQSWEETVIAQEIERKHTS